MFIYECDFCHKEVDATNVKAVRHGPLVLSFRGLVPEYNLDLCESRYDKIKSAIDQCVS